ncbi:putative nuclease HARBI1 [Ischnura elegans]|uniref:putative nuclease HARBI1 n=1 Tax=Ischnura elegans TaxID=197161 RepID=UPI001ED89D04|nr:putative nuclease HARBI1 [Ischnura elegans]
MFDMLCRELAPFIGRQDTAMRPALPVAKRVAVALFYLKSGSDYGVVGLALGVGKATVHVIVRDFCRAVLDRYFMEYIVFPSTEEEMAAKENCFRTRWNFPGTIGAIDGCHIPMKTPIHGGADYYNYKGWHSVILSAVVDSQYRWRVLLKASEVDVARLVEVINTSCILNNICEENREVFWAGWLEEANAAENMFPQPQDEAGGDNLVDGKEKGEVLAQQLYDAMR